MPSKLISSNLEVDYNVYGPSSKHIKWLYIVVD